MNSKVMPKWLDRYPIIDADHVHDLETRAAIGEFMHKLPRHEAEAKAHADYQKDQLAEAAAHHLMGMQSAHALGAMEEAKKHGMMYALAMRKLGHDPVGEPPPEVTKKAKDRAQTDPIHKFKAHKGDVFSLPEQEDMEKSEPLEKRSKNVRQQVANITPHEAEQRRVKYAQSIGLKPVSSDFSRATATRFPQANRNKLPHGDYFGVEHETAHAMMTPPGKTIRQYQDHLSSHADPAPPEEDDGSIDKEHEGTTHHENVANQLENLIDRRAGVSPSKFRSEFRPLVSKPKDQDEMPEGWVDEQATQKARYHQPLPPAPTSTQRAANRNLEIPGRDTREEAQEYARDFDEGARFDQYGRIRHTRYPGNVPAAGVDTLDQRINRARGGVKWLRDIRDRMRIRAENARMNGGRGPDTR